MTDTKKRFDGMASALRYHASEGRIFDHSNDTVVVTRTLLLNAAQEIEDAYDEIKELKANG